MLDLRSRVVAHWPFAGPVYITHIKKPRREGPLEEETLTHYRPELFYPVRVGQTLNKRFVVLAKLGYGAHATIWMCFDKVQKCHFAVKVGIAQPLNSKNCTTLDCQEMAAYKRLKNTHADDLALQPLVRRIIAMEAAESFILRSHKRKSQHLCLVFPAAVADLGMLQPGLQEQSTHEAVKLCKEVLKSLLVALDYLHTHANVIHCDIKPDNILFRARNEQTRYAEIANNVKKLPLGARWSKKDRRSTWETVHLADFVPREFWDIPVLGDLGDAKICDKFGQRFKTETVCCEPFRPPEVRLGMGWGAEIDIWGVGMVVGIMLSNKLMFGISRKTGDEATTEYLARMQGIMGKPPQEFLDRVPKNRKYWDKNGGWAKKHSVQVVNRPLESLGWKVDKEEEPALLEFLRGIFTWRPEERKMAKDLLESKWLQS